MQTYAYILNNKYGNRHTCTQINENVSQPNNNDVNTRMMMREKLHFAAFITFWRGTWRER